MTSVGAGNGHGLDLADVAVQALHTGGPRRVQIPRSNHHIAGRSRVQQTGRGEAQRTAFPTVATQPRLLLGPPRGPLGGPRGAGGRIMSASGKQWKERKRTRGTKLKS